MDDQTVISFETRNELLVFGYVRIQTIKCKCDQIPADVMNLCFLWYHVNSYFIECGDSCHINKNRNIVKHIGPSQRNSCYGSIVMPSISHVNIEYKFRIKILTAIDAICIGMDSADCAHINSDFAGQTETYNYAYFNMNGQQYNWNLGMTSASIYGEPYVEGNIITMCYNPFHATLRFKRNDVDQGIIKNIYANKNHKYRLAVYLGMFSGTELELL
eukprot:410141_1